MKRPLQNVTFAQAGRATPMKYAALVRLLALGVPVRCGRCDGSRIIGGERETKSGTVFFSRPCPACVPMADKDDTDR